jgi:hypothetical protein
MSKILRCISAGSVGRESFSESTPSMGSFATMKWLGSHLECLREKRSTPLPEMPFEGSRSMPASLIISDASDEVRLRDEHKEREHRFILTFARDKTPARQMFERDLGYFRSVRL